MAHQVVILESCRFWRAGHVGVGSGFTVDLLVARKYSQYDLIGVVRRHARHDRKVAMDIRAPIFADTENVRCVWKSPQPIGFFVAQFERVIRFLEQVDVPPDAAEVLFPRVALREPLSSDDHLSILHARERERLQTNAAESVKMEGEKWSLRMYKRQYEQ